MLEDYIEENLPDKRDSWITWSLLTCIVAPLTVVHTFYIKFYRSFTLLFLSIVITVCTILLYFQLESLGMVSFIWNQLCGCEKKKKGIRVGGPVEKTKTDPDDVSSLRTDID